MRLAIVVIAYARADSLRRLLDNLNSCNYPTSVPLIISIDQANNSSSETVAKNFKWHHGSKEVIKHPDHLGLKKHVLLCGDLTNKYDGIIMLEDDLLVSEDFYAFASTALDAYSDNYEIAGVSLYSYQITENNFLPFEPIDSDFDTYLMQVPCSWGQAWNKEQWHGFRIWLESNSEINESLLPRYVQEWGGNSWKKHFFQYLIDRNKYFLFPKKSLSTNLEEPGTHAKTQGLFQVPLSKKSEWNFDPQLSVKYDSWFEPEAQVLKAVIPSVSKFHFEVDLYGTKEDFTAEHVVTTKQTQNSEMSWGADLFPLHKNMEMKLSGEEIHLAKTNLVNTKSRPNSKLFFNGLEHLIDFHQLEPKMEVSILYILSERCNEDVLKNILNGYSNQNAQLKMKVFSDYTELKHDHAKISKLNRSIEDGVSEIVFILYDTPFNTLQLEAAKSIFTDFRNISALQFYPESENPINYRFNEYLLSQRLKKNSFISGGIVVRKHVIEEANAQNMSLKTLDECLLTIMKITGIYPVLSNPMKNPGLMTVSRKTDQALTETKYSIKKKIINSLCKLIIHKSALANVIFQLSNDLPDVLRYDDKNDTYYLSRV